MWDSLGNPYLRGIHKGPATIEPYLYYKGVKHIELVVYINCFADNQTVKAGDGVPLPAVNGCTDPEPASSICQEIDITITAPHAHGYGVPDRSTVADISCVAIFQARGREYDGVKRQNNPNPNFEACDVYSAQHNKAASERGSQVVPYHGPACRRLFPADGAYVVYNKHMIRRQIFSGFWVSTSALQRSSPLLSPGFPFSASTTFQVVLEWSANQTRNGRQLAPLRRKCEPGLCVGEQRRCWMEAYLERGLGAVALELSAGAGLLRRSLQVHPFCSPLDPTSTWGTLAENN